MNQLVKTWRGIVILPLLLAGVCHGASALIVRDGTVGLDANVTLNLSTALTTAGYTVVTNVGVPGSSLSTYKEVWDIRFNDVVLSPSDTTAYRNYLSGGGSLFLMGENTGWALRDGSLTTFITAAGGGNITVVNSADAQTVLTPLTGPSAVAALSYFQPGGSATSGSGSFFTKDSSNLGAAIVWPRGTLSGSPNGIMMVVFDVNFMTTTADANSHALLANMIGFLGTPIPTPPATVPTASTIALLLMVGGLGGIALYRMRRHTSSLN